MPDTVSNLQYFVRKQWAPSIQKAVVEGWHQQGGMQWYSLRSGAATLVGEFSKRVPRFEQSGLKLWCKHICPCKNTAVWCSAGHPASQRQSPPAAATTTKNREEGTPFSRSQHVRSRWDWSACHTDPTTKITTPQVGTDAAG